MKETDAPEDIHTAVPILEEAEAIEPQPAKDSYPPVSSIPNTSPERLAQAATDAPKEVAEAATTVLYLAYGSNMAAETFLGMRKIRPLSQMNVSVPVLQLTFDLPGLPYREPCFANVGYRKLPEKPKLPDPFHPPIVPPLKPPKFGHEWDGGLMGVVYEVTQDDFRQIARTEGAGVGYQEIMVPCVPMPAEIGVPEKPSWPELPKPFLARTLYAPYIPLDADSGKKNWWAKLITGPHRPNPDYAQPSARYLKLLQDGAREHELPQAYQDYLASMQPYTITTIGQKIARILFMLYCIPMMVFFLAATKILADERGKVPRWCATIMSVLVGILWLVYDSVFKAVFGDGERTEEPKEKKVRRKSYAGGTDEEKMSLIQDQDA